MIIMDSQPPKAVIESTADSLHSLAANMESRSAEITPEELKTIAERLHEHAADLTLAASRLV